MIETVRVSERARYQLMTIRKGTGIENWNVICRWALVVSLKDQSIPPHENIVTDSSVEMTWRTFGGTYEKTYLGLLIQRLINDKIEITKNLDIIETKIYGTSKIIFLKNFKNLSKSS